ncbi:hypothetical protein HDZ31DRAFT_62858 [Schizophyllum fasciatum]
MPFTSPYSPFFTSGLLVHGAPTTPASLVGTPPLSDATGYFGAVHSASTPSDVALGPPDMSTRDGFRSPSPIATSSQHAPSDLFEQSTQITWDSPSGSVVHPCYEASTPTFDGQVPPRPASPAIRERKRSDALAVLEGDRSRASDILTPVASPSAASSEEPYLLLAVEAPGTPSSLSDCAEVAIESNRKAEGCNSKQQPRASSQLMGKVDGPSQVQLVRRRSKSAPRDRTARHDRQSRAKGRKGQQGSHRHGHDADAVSARPASESLASRRARSVSPYRLTFADVHQPMSFMEMQTPETETVPQ